MRPKLKQLLRARQLWLAVFFLSFATLPMVKLLLARTAIAYGDCSPFPETARQAFNAFFYTWQPHSLGLQRHSGQLFPLLQAGFLFLSGNNSVLAQKLFFVFLNLAGLGSSYFFLRKLFRLKTPFALLGSVIYLYNPALLDEFLGGTNYTTIFGFHLLPLVATLVFSFLFAKFNLKKLLLAGLVFYLYFSFFNAGMVVFLFFFIAISLLALLRKKQRGKEFLHLIIKLSLPVFVALTINPTIFLSSLAIVPQLNRLVPHPQADANQTLLKQLEQQPGDPFASFASDIKFTYKAINPLAILMLGTNNSPLRHSALTNPANWGGLVFVLLAIWGALLAWRRKKPPLRALTLLAGSVYIFIILTKLGILLPLYRLLPFLFTFRNPAKLLLLIALPLTSFATLALQTLWEKGLPSGQRKGVFATTLFVLIVFYWPMFTGDKWLGKAREAYTVPPSFYEVGKFLQQKRAEDGFFRSLWLPNSFEETGNKLVWLDEWTAHPILGMAQFSSLPGQEMLGRLRASLLARDGSLERLASDLSVRFIILNKESNQTGEPRLDSFYSTIYNKGSPARIDEYLRRAKLVLRQETNSYAIYENPSWRGRFQAFSGEPLPLIDLSATATIRSLGVSLPTKLATTSATLVSLPTKPFLGKSLQASKAPLPFASVSPQRRVIHQLVMLKERFLRFLTRGNQDKRADLDLWLATKRAVEYSQFPNRQTAKRYREHLLRLEEDLEKISKEDFLSRFRFFAKTSIYLEKQANLLRQAQQTSELLDKLREKVAPYQAEGNLLAVTSPTGKDFPAEEYFLLARDLEWLDEKEELKLITARQAISVAKGGEISGWWRSTPFQLPNNTLQLVIATPPPPLAVPDKLPERKEDCFWQTELSNLAPKTKYSLAFNTFNNSEKPLDLLTLAVMDANTGKPLLEKQFRHLEAGKKAELGAEFITARETGKLFFNFYLKKEGSCSQETISFEKGKFILRRETHPQLALLRADGKMVSPEPARWQDLDFRQLTPTKFLVRPEGKLKKGDILIFNDNYDPRWQLRGVAVTNRFIANSFANGWELAEDAPEQFLVEFAYQKTFEEQLLVSLLALGGTIGFLLVAKLARR